MDIYHKCYIAWSIIFVAIGLLILFILLSYDSLIANEVGLDYNGIKMNISPNKLYTVGRYFLGVGHRFIRYDISLHSISFNTYDNTCLISRTFDGLPVNFSVNFQYSLNINLTDIVQLYNKYGSKGYEEAYRNLAKSNLINTIAEFTATDIYNNRSGLTEKMITTLRSALLLEHAFLNNLQIVNITMPSEYTAALIEAQNSFLNKDIAQSILINTKILVSNRLNQARLESSILRNKADILVQTIYKNSNITTALKKNYLQNMKQAYLKIKNQLKFSNKDLITFLFANNIDKLNYANFPIPNLLNCLSNSSLPQCG